MIKKVKYSLPAEMINMGGIFVKQALPTLKVDQVDPFLLLHHGSFKFNESAPARQQGIGPHPHRGFSPVTFVIGGEIRHRDSRGNDQIAKTGEVQWMHAGAGIIHSERPTDAVVKEGGVQEVIQLWINSPARSKMKQPEYQYVSKENMVAWEEGPILHKLIAGEWKDKKGNIQTESDLLIIWSSFSDKGEASYAIPNGFNASVYVIKGDVQIEGYGKVDAETLLVLNSEGTDIVLQGDKDTQLLVLAGQPLNEKVAQHGPFVMNNQTEILEAMRDYQMGKMGVLIEV